MLKKYVALVIATLLAAPVFAVGLPNTISTPSEEQAATAEAAQSTPTASDKPETKKAKKQQKNKAKQAKQAQKTADNADITNNDLTLADNGNGNGNTTEEE